jgi:CRP-like cAMP-binding protein
MGLNILKRLPVIDSTRRIRRTVVREEEVGQTFFIIVEGEVEVTKQVEGQTERVLQRHGSGDFFGEMALIETLPRTATVRTVTPSTLLAKTTSTQCYPSNRPWR